MVCPQGAGLQTGAAKAMGTVSSIHLRFFFRQRDSLGLMFGGISIKQGNGTVAAATI